MKMLVLTPEQVKEVCKAEEDERRRKDSTRRTKKEHRKQRLSLIAGVRGLDLSMKKLDIHERQNLLSMWMKNARSSQNTINKISSDFNKKILQIARRRLGSAMTKKKVKKGDVPMVDLSNCKYEVLRIVLRKNGWEEGGEDDKKCHLIWTDLSVGCERLMSLKRGQKINHFHGMLSICRKKSLFRSLSTMRKLFPTHYKFFPRAFILPNQLIDLLGCFSTSKVRTYILKPDNGSQGRGVVLAQSANDVRHAIDGYPGSNLLAQKYLASPMLLNGYKFDLRIYVLILSCDPLRLYLYREGITRFCTERYQKPGPGNLSTSCMHLTNYALNKYNTNFHFNTNANETNKGHKWTLSSLFKALSIRGFDVVKLHNKICQIAVMTILAIVPLLQHNYKTYVGEDDHGHACFELLGMDVLIDNKCNPWLLEVNHSPSFTVDTPLDLKVKESLITDTLKLVRMDPSGYSKLRMQDRKGARMRLYGRNLPHPPEKPKSRPTTQQQVIFHLNHDFEEHEAKNIGKYERIYPSNDKKMQDLYNVFLAGSESAFKHSFDMKVKDTIAKVREDHKQEQLDKEEEGKQKIRWNQEIRKKAQRSARAVALAANSASAKVYTGISCDIGNLPLSDRRLKEVDCSVRGVINSPKSLKEDHIQERWSTDRSVCDLKEDNYSGQTKSMSKEDFDSRAEMTVQEKVKNWKQAGCFGASHEDILFDLSQRKESDAMLDERHEEGIEHAGKRDGGVLLMLGQDEEQLLLDKVEAQHGHSQVSVLKSVLQKKLYERRYQLKSSPVKILKKDGKVFLGIDGRQSETYQQARQQEKNIQSRDELHTKNPENLAPQQQLPTLEREVPKCLSIPSCTDSEIFESWGQCAKVIDCRSLLPAHESTRSSPVPKLKLCINKVILARPKICQSKQERMMVTRRYHGKLPELVRNENFFTIQGYTLPASMAHMARFVPRPPKHHEQFAVVRRPIFQPESAGPYLVPINSLQKTSRSKSRHSSEYINQARYRVQQIDKLYENWQWKTRPPIPKGVFPKSSETHLQ